MRRSLHVLAATAALAGCRSTGNGAALRAADGQQAGPDVDAELGEQAQPDEALLTAEIAAAVKAQVAQAYPAGTQARRDAHPKAHGCVRASFTVRGDLPETLAQGAFVKGRAYKAWIRFSNGDSDPSRPDDKGDARGMAIKLTGVPGDKLLAEAKAEQTQDFILINHPVFFADSVRSYLGVVQKVGSSNPLTKLTLPLALGIKGTLIARDIAAKRIATPLETRFWSMVPYRLGDDQHKQAVKYSAIPCASAAATIPAQPGPDYLREAMVAELSAKAYCFDFLVQPRTTPSMSIENSMTEWREAEAPFVAIARITIPKQVFSSKAQDQFCESLSFTPWHALPDHRPLGAMNRVRRVVYEEVSALRHRLNAAPRAEPTGDEVF